MSETRAERTKWNDERAERIIGTLLQSGVIISGLVVLAGGIFYVLRYAHVPMEYASFVSSRESLPAMREVAKDALHGDPREIIEIGLLLLIATPVARVLFSIVAFWLEGDRLYVALTAIVFLILIYSLFGGAI